MDYERWRVAELKEQFRALGIPINGSKEALVLRLRAADTRRGNSHSNEAFDDEEGSDSSD